MIESFRRDYCIILLLVTSVIGEWLLLQAYHTELIDEVFGVGEAGDKSIILDLSYRWGFKRKSYYTSPWLRSPKKTSGSQCVLCR